MENIYDSLKNIYQDLLKENKLNNIFIPVLLVLLSISLCNTIGNIVLAIFLIVCFKSFFKTPKIKFQTSLMLPIFLYGLMLLSFIWTIDKTVTAAAIIKELPLFLIPLGFIISQKLSQNQRQKIIEYYSYAILVLVVYFSLRAIIRYFLLHDSRVFFFHGEYNNDYGLVPKLINAIHVSVFVSVAFFNFLTKNKRTKKETIYSGLLLGFIFLLSAKSITLTVLFLVFFYIFFLSKTAKKMRLRNLIVFGGLLVILFSLGKIKDNFQKEIHSHANKSLSSNVIEGIPDATHYVSINEAWTSKTFNPNDYFPGTAFRIYQFRIFIEMMKENNVFFTGFGLNTSYSKIKEKGIQYNIFMGSNGNDGYQDKNFHNQYIQNFAELGVFGFLILVTMLFINVKNAYKTKDFVHFAFAILMISLFLTESFLWRQRGVVFFTVLYCLFNSGIVNHSKAK